MKPLRILLTLLLSGLLVSFSTPSLADTSTALAEAKAAIDAKDYAKASEIYQTLAQEGNAKAQYNLAVMYQFGDGVKQDYPEAERLYKLSADQGFAEAQYNLGVIYLTNKFATPNYAESLKYYQLAALQGHEKSQLNLGMIYLKGEVVQQDYEAALKWLTKAAEQGNAEAQFDLGNMYLHGEGIAEDMERGYMWAKPGSGGPAGAAQQPQTQKFHQIPEFKMPAEQVATAKQLVEQCHAKALKGC